MTQECMACDADLTRDGSVIQRGYRKGKYDANGYFVKTGDFSDSDDPDECRECGEPI